MGDGPMATTHRSKPRPNCEYCRGFGIVSVSKDPDEVADCVCTDQVDDPRWRVACINWTWPDAPHALTYLLIDGDAHVERFHDSWEDAVAWLESFGDKLATWADFLTRMKRERGLHRV